MRWGRRKAPETSAARAGRESNRGLAPADAAWVLRLVDSVVSQIEFAQQSGESNPILYYLAADVDGSMDGTSWPEPFLSELKDRALALRELTAG